MSYALSYPRSKRAAAGGCFCAARAAFPQLSSEKFSVSSTSDCFYENTLNYATL